jgi:hypothetical protein
MKHDINPAIVAFSRLSIGHSITADAPPVSAGPNYHSQLAFFMINARQTGLIASFEIAQTVLMLYRPVPGPGFGCATESDF